MGVAGELICILNSIKHLKENNDQILPDSMPKQLNFIPGYENVLIGLVLMCTPSKFFLLTCDSFLNMPNIYNLCIYFLVVPKLYLHMFAQRKKVLENSSKKD